MKRFHAPSANQAKFLFEKAMALHEKGLVDEAKPLYQQVLQRMPKQPDAMHMLGVIAFQKNDFTTAVDWMLQAYAIQPQNATLLFNLGNAHRGTGNLDAAENMYLRALEILPPPGNTDTLKNLGNVYKEKNDLFNAIATYDKLLAQDPTHTYTLYNKAIALLTIGNLQEAWPLYENRLAIDSTNIRCCLSRSMAPIWDGSLLDKPLLVLPEQGLGDQIFYGSLLGELEKNNIPSIVCLDSRLIELFKRSFKKIEFVNPTDLQHIDTSNNDFGAQIYLASLGRFFRKTSTDFNSIHSPYLFADTNATNLLKQKLQNKGKLMCGLSWDSKHIENGRTKRMALEKLLPALNTPDVHFVDLQYGDTHAERHQLEETHGIAIEHIDDIDNFHEIDKLAGLIQACDVLVTISNSTAHLAAALGKPSLVMLPHHTPLWYWHLESMTSPWYPTVTLLRQTEPGNWDPVVAQAAAILRGLTNSD